MSIALGLVGVVLLILANAFFVVAEFAYVAVDRTQVDIEAETGSRPAKLAASILRRMNFHLSGAQLGITLSSLALGVLIEPVVAPIFEPVFGTFLRDSGATAWSVVLALLLTTVVQMVVGELVPKSVAVSRPLPTALRVAAPFRIFVAAFRPAIAACNALANVILSMVGIEPTEEISSTRSRQELRRLVQSSQERGTLREQTALLLDRAFRFRDKTAADAMTPRPDVRALPESATTAALLDASAESGLSRFPVFGDAGEHDDLDEVVGVVHVKDILGIAPERRSSTPLVELLRPVLMVPESKPLDDLMEELQPESGQFAVVLDEYGSLAGIVTLEDLVEEIVGDIADEHDPVVPTSTSRRWAGAHLLSGRLHRDEVEEVCGLDFPDGEYETLAGFVLDQMGTIPTVGMGFTYDGWQLRVTEMDGRRIAIVRVRRTAASAVGRRRSGIVRAERPVNGVSLVLVAFGLIAVNGLFVAVEFSLLASRRSRIEEWVDEGRFGAVSALAGMRTVNVQLAASQLGITVCSLLLGWLIEPVVGDGFETLFGGISWSGRAADALSVVLALVIVALFHMVLGEMIPKSVALAGPERTAVLLVPLHRGFVLIVRPVVRVLYKLGYWGTKAIGVEPADELITAHTPAELAVMIEESRAGGELEAGERDLLAGALGYLGVRTVDVMAPRDMLVIVPATATVSEAEDLMHRSGHSRVLVAGDGDSIKGFLHAKDLLKLADSARDGLLPGGLVRRALHVGPDDRLPDLLPRMRRDRRHVAVVVDDDQRVMGLVTLEDILEAIIGDIRDESDRSAEP